ncbi:hypothetical protein OJE16_22080 [Pantoea tagorei]
MFPVGIDVSKNTLDLCMLYDGIKGRIKTRNIRNDRGATENIIRWLRLQHCGPQDVHLIIVRCDKLPFTAVKKLLKASYVSCKARYKRIYLTAFGIKRCSQTGLRDINAVHTGIQPCCMTSRPFSVRKQPVCPIHVPCGFYYTGKAMEIVLFSKRARAWLPQIVELAGQPRASTILTALLQQPLNVWSDISGKAMLFQISRQPASYKEVLLCNGTYCSVFSGHGQGYEGAPRQMAALFCQ